MFAGKEGAYPSEVPFRCSTLGYAPTTNIRLGWKGLPGTNSLAYFENPLITAVISFMIQAPRANNMKIITVIIYGFL